jgi:SAM-dependent methyltransferase
MHASSLENMRECYRRYIAGGPLEAQAETVVLDLGGADVNGTYRDVFSKALFRYRAADMEAGPGVDIVLDDPYRIPLPDGSIDIVLSGQMFEHSEFFWRAFEEMARVVRPEGFIFLIAPSAGPIHRYPVDCYRFYPDAYVALAKHAGCVLVQSWLDERGPWRDLVGVFRRSEAPPFEVKASPPPFMPSSWSGASGTAEEEATRGAVSYLEVLDRLHRELTPAHYLEIGVGRGASLALARGPATGIDPIPALDGELPAMSRIVPLTSDDFFAQSRTASRPISA